MKKKTTFIFSLFIFSLKVVYAQASDPTPPVSLTIALEGIDLSEDLSVVSSKDDELILMIYPYNDASILSVPLVLRELKTDVNHRNKSITIDSLYPGAEQWILFLLERDSERSLEQIDPVLRIHFRKIIEEFEKRDYYGIENYLEDEDVLGYAVFATSELIAGKPLSFKGIYKMDGYHYQLLLQFN